MSGFLGLFFVGLSGWRDFSGLGGATLVGDRAGMVGFWICGGLGSGDGRCGWGLGCSGFWGEIRGKVGFGSARGRGVTGGAVNGTRSLLLGFVSIFG